MPLTAAQIAQALAKAKADLAKSQAGAAALKKAEALKNKR